jgi:hypothetical protein
VFGGFGGSFSGPMALLGLPERIGGIGAAMV